MSFSFPVDLFLMFPYCSDDEPLELSKRESKQIADQLFENDEKARKAKDEHTTLTTRIAELRESNPKNVSL